jgi:hypothetical protein
MNERECLTAIAAGETSYELLIDAMPGIERKFKRVDRAIIDLLTEVKHHFPDAQYYTASGGFVLMLGKPHSDDHDLTSQQQLIALGGYASIGDGDF